MDNLSPKQRSETMRRVRSSGTRPEMAVSRLIRGLGFAASRTRMHLPGKPDFLFVKARKAVFVHGCFWHRHNCPAGQKVPATNRGYWGPKLSANKARDGRTRRALAKLGWSELIIWECQLMRSERVRVRLARFLGGRA